MKRAEGEGAAGQHSCASQTQGLSREVAEGEGLGFQCSVEGPRATGHLEPEPGGGGVGTWQGLRMRWGMKLTQRQQRTTCLFCLSQSHQAGPFPPFRTRQDQTCTCLGRGICPGYCTCAPALALREPLAGCGGGDWLLDRRTGEHGNGELQGRGPRASYPHPGQLWTWWPHGDWVPPICQPPHSFLRCSGGSCLLAGGDPNPLVPAFWGPVLPARECL